MNIKNTLSGEKASITLNNIRSLTLSLSLASYFMYLNMGFLAVSFGIILGAYYGLKIERETFYSGLNTDLKAGSFPFLHLKLPTYKQSFQ